MNEKNNSIMILEKEDIVQKITKIFWVFLIGSILGYIIEMIVGLVQNGHFVSRQGLLFGPFIQVYGVGSHILFSYFQYKKEELFENILHIYDIRWHRRIFIFIFSRKVFWNNILGLQ